MAVRVRLKKQPAREEAFPALAVCAAPAGESILHKHVTAGGQKRQLPESTRTFISNDTRGVLVVPGGEAHAEPRKHGSCTELVSS